MGSEQTKVRSFTHFKLEECIFADSKDARGETISNSWTW
jgi:hypothetical protein